VGRWFSVVRKHKTERKETREKGEDDGATEKTRVCRRGSEVGIKREEERLMRSAWSLQVEKEITLSVWPCDEEKHASCVAHSEKRK
jgi:hypothetical protein